MVEWMKDAFFVQLQRLVAKHMDMRIHNTLLRERVRALEALELKEEVEEINGMFMTTIEVDSLETELMETSQALWVELKHRLQVIARRPYEAFASACYAT